MFLVYSLNHGHQQIHFDYLLCAKDYAQGMKTD